MRVINHLVLLFCLLLPILGRHENQTFTSNIIYRINHAAIDIPNRQDHTDVLYSIGVRSYFKHSRLKREWLGEERETPVGVCVPTINRPSNTTLRPFNATFLSCTQVWNNTILANYDEPIQYMRSAGWPCKDEHIHDVDGWTRRHIVEGYIMLPDEATAIAVKSCLFTCHMLAPTKNQNDLPIVIQNNIIMQQIHLITSGASRKDILDSSSDYVAKKMETFNNKYSPHSSKKLASSKHYTNQITNSMTFLESNEWMKSLPGMQQILEPAVEGIISPVANVVASELGKQVSQDLTTDLNNGLRGQLTGDVAAMLEQTLSANLTNILTDSITSKLSDSLTTSITEELGTYLDKSITDAAQPRLHTALHNILSESIPKRLNRDIPTLLIRSLKIGLVQTVTRTVTHSLVPSLALSLTHNKHQDYFCYVCFHYHLYCRVCHYSPQSSYYLQYYSGYYSDYFATFYADYYTQALINVDTIEHPLSHWKGKSGPGGAEKGNGYALSKEKGDSIKKKADAKKAGELKGSQPQHTSLNDEMLKVGNGEPLGRKQSPEVNDNEGVA